MVTERHFLYCSVQKSSPKLSSLSLSVKKAECLLQGCSDYRGNLELHQTEKHKPRKNTQNTKNTQICQTKSTFHLANSRLSFCFFSFIPNESKKLQKVMVNWEVTEQIYLHGEESRDFQRLWTRWKMWLLWNMSVEQAVQQHFLRFKDEEQEASVYPQNTYKHIIIMPKWSDAHLQGNTAWVSSKCFISGLQCNHRTHSTAYHVTCDLRRRVP